jgi:tRNA (guanine-N7-)-methyltransferase
LHNLAINHPNYNFLGIEAYLNGVNNILKLCQNNKPSNLFIYPNDADLLLDKIPDNFVEAFYIFFPDPWPKHKHHKRRFINKTRVELMVRKLKPLGVIKFITDVEDYFVQVKALFSEHPLLDFIYDNFDGCFGEYIPTKYHQKALNNGKKVSSLIINKKQILKL